MKYYLAYLLVLGYLYVSAQESSKKIYSTTKIENAPNIDGVFDEEEWNLGNWSGNFTQHEPLDGGVPSEKTEFKIIYDESHLYVAIKAYDTKPSEIFNRMTRRDNIDGDFVGIAFDSFHDLRTGFIFIVSAAGVKMDMLMSNDGFNEDPSWDPIWHVKTQIWDWGWSAEMKIPFTQLRFENNSDDVWGLEVMRQIYRHGEVNFWQAIPRNGSGVIHFFGELAGLENIEPRKILDLTPYTVAGKETYEAEEGNPFASGRDFTGNIGLDGKIGITNNLTLDFTVNPDFGQVEADPSQVNLTAYEVFFRERRPFFVEGKNITSVGLGIGDGDIGNDNLFYSRRIGRRPSGNPSLEDGEYYKTPRNVRILAAAKITGKTKKGLSLGIVESITPRTYSKIDSAGVKSKQEVEPLTNYLVARVQKDINEGNTMIGGIITHTYRALSGVENIENSSLNELHNSAITGGIDFSQFFLDKNWGLNITTAFSNVSGSEEAITATQLSSRHFYQRPDANHMEFDPSRTQLNGMGGKVEFGKFGGNWNFMAFSTFKSPGFEINDLGFSRSSDEAIMGLWSAYSFIEPKSFYRSIRINGNVWLGSDFTLSASGQGGNINISTQFKNFWMANMGTNFGTESESTALLRGGPNMYLPGRLGYFGFVQSDNRKKIIGSLQGNYTRGNDDYFENSSISAEIGYRPLDNFQFSLEPSVMKIRHDLQYVTLKQNEQMKDRYIFATINQRVLSLSVRLNYSVTPDMSIQYWGQPFFAMADFSEIKVIDQPKAEQFQDRFHLFEPNEIQYIDDTYYIDEDVNGTTDYSFGNPDFTFDEFLSNLVFRWEFVPGSTLFAVWSQSRNAYIADGNTELSNNINTLFKDEKPYNVFLLKFSYRIGLH